MVWQDARWLARPVRRRLKGRRRYAITGTPAPQEVRRLAEVMRHLPGHYANRLTPRTLRGIQDAAAAGQWEHALDRLLAALRARSAPATATERAELRAVLAALYRPADRVNALRPHTSASALRTIRRRPLAQ